MLLLCRFDRCICSYDVDKLDKPKEAFKRVKDCARAGLTSLAFDPHNNVLLAGSLDGALRVWSVEGRWAWGKTAACMMAHGASSVTTLLGGGSAAQITAN
jgi:WD40 repeat protein